MQFWRSLTRRDRPRLETRDAIKRSATHTISSLVLVALAGVGSGQRLRLVPQLGTRASYAWVVAAPDASFVCVTSIPQPTRLYDLATGALLREFGSREWDLFALALSRDGRYLLATGLTPYELWDTSTGELVTNFNSGAKKPEKVAFSPDGKFVLVRYGQAVELRDVKSGTLVRRVEGSPVAADISPDSASLAIADGAGSVKIWNVRTGKSKCAFASRAGRVSDVAFLPGGGSLLVEVADGSAELWDTGAGMFRRTVTPASKSGRSSFQLPTSGNRILRILTDDKVVRAELWNTNTGELLNAISVNSYENTDYHAGAFFDTRTLNAISVNSYENMALSPDGSEILTYKASTIEVLNALSGSVIHSLPFNPSRFVRSLFLPGGRAAAVVDQNRLVDVATGDLIADLGGRALGVPSVAFGPDRTKMLIEGDLWDNIAGSLVQVGGLKGDNAFARDGRTFRVMSPQVDDTVWRPIVKDWLSVGKVFSTPRGDQFVVCRLSGEVEIWKVKTRNLVRTLSEHRDYVEAVAFSSDGRLMLTGSFDKTSKLWELSSGKCLRTLSGHSQPILSVALSSDGSMALTGSIDGTARLWNLTSGKELCSVIDFCDDGRDLNFRDNGAWAVVAPDGRYDSSNGGYCEDLHWVMGNRPIAISQFRDAFYEKGLLAKLMGFDHSPRRQVPSLDDLTLNPDVQVTARGDVATVTARGQDNGGIGKLRVWVNDNLIAEPQAPPDKQKEWSYSVDLKDPAIARYLKPGMGQNHVEALAFNHENTLASPRAVSDADPVSAASSRSEKPRLYALVVGSDYPGTMKKLGFAAGDAISMADAIESAAKEMGVYSDVNVTRLIREQEGGRYGQPTKANILKALGGIVKVSESTDVVVIYFSGHGTNVAAGRPGYYYLTAEYNDEDTQNDPLASKYTLSAEELRAQVATLSANHIGLILDTCAAGSATLAFLGRDAIDQAAQSALDRLRETKGFYILPGCADGQQSYESTALGHGLLTYALLEPLADRSGDVLTKDGSLIDVDKWFRYAEDRVPALGAEVGIDNVQRPERLVLANAQEWFPLGKVDDKVAQAIDLAAPKPLVAVLEALDTNGEDSLNLTGALRAALSSASRGAAFALEGEEAAHPRAVGLQLWNYTRTSTGVSGTVRLKRFVGGAWQKVKELQVRGLPTDVNAAAEALYKQIEPAIREVWLEIQKG